MEERTAVLVPCYNEEVTIGDVVRNFSAQLPKATIYVYDNNSTDNTASEALAAGAIVRGESLQGKGNVVRRMFSDIEADVYILVDGDGTYDPASAPRLIQNLVERRLDMVSASRVAEHDTAYPAGHRFGNAFLSGMVCAIFGNRIQDILSGYRVFSRRFVKSFPALSLGFEIETELTVHALELRMPVEEIPTPYYARPSGSASKLSTFWDGLRILKTIVDLVRDERPIAFFGTIAAVLITTSLILAWPVLIEFLDTGLVPRLPTALLSTGIMLLAFLSLTSGLILETVTRGRREMRRLHYLTIPTLPFLQFGARD